MKDHQKKWEERFDDEFGTRPIISHPREDVKSFISSLLHSQKKELVKILKTNKFKRIDNDLTWYLNYDNIISKLEELWG